MGRLSLESLITATNAGEDRLAARAAEALSFLSDKAEELDQATSEVKAEIGRALLETAESNARPSWLMDRCFLLYDLASIVDRALIDANRLHLAGCDHLRRWRAAAETFDRELFGSFLDSVSMQESFLDQLLGCVRKQVRQSVNF